MKSVRKDITASFFGQVWWQVSEEDYTLVEKALVFQLKVRVYRAVCVPLKDIVTERKWLWW